MQVWACFAILAKYLGKYKAGCMTQFKTINEYDTRQIVLDAVHELYASSQVASRSLVTTMTGLKPALVDDSLKVLCEPPRDCRRPKHLRQYRYEKQTICSRN